MLSRDNLYGFRLLNADIRSFYIISLNGRDIRLFFRLFTYAIKIHIQRIEENQNYKQKNIDANINGQAPKL